MCGWAVARTTTLLAFSAKVEAAYAAEAAVAADGSAPNIVQICKRMLAANEGQNRFGEVARPFLLFLKDFSDYNDVHFVYKKQMGQDMVFYVLDLASGALTSLHAVDSALLEEAVLLPTAPLLSALLLLKPLSDPLSAPFSDSPSNCVFLEPPVLGALCWNLCRLLCRIL